MASAATLHIGIKANTIGLSKGLDKGQRDIRGFSRRVEESGGKLRAFGGGAQRAGMSVATKLTAALAAGVATVVSFDRAVRAVNSSLTRLDELAKRSRNLGIDPNSLQAIRLAAAELSGFDTGRTDASIERMVKRLGEASLGFGEAKPAIEQMGLALDELTAMTPDEQFNAIVGGLERITERSQKVAIATKIFGRDAIGLVNTLDAGAGVVEQYRNVIRDLGLEMSTEQLAAVEATNDAWGRVSLAAEGLVNQFTAELAPSLLAVARTFLEAIPGPDGLLAAIKRVTEFIKNAMPPAAAAVNGLISVIEFLGSVSAMQAGVIISAFGAVETLLEKLAGIRIGLNLSEVGADLVKLSGELAVDSVSRFGDAVSGRTAQAMREQIAAVEQELANLKPKTDAPLIDLEGDEADAAAQKWKELGERLTDSVKTPFEQAADAIREAHEALQRGVITQDTFNRIVAKSRAQLTSMADATRKATQEAKTAADFASGLTGAAIVGTREGFSALQQGLDLINRQKMAEQENAKQLVDEMARIGQDEPFDFEHVARLADRGKGDAIDELLRTLRDSPIPDEGKPLSLPLPEVQFDASKLPPMEPLEARIGVQPKLDTAKTKDKLQVEKANLEQLIQQMQQRGEEIPATFFRRMGAIDRELATLGRRQAPPIKVDTKPLDDAKEKVDEVASGGGRLKGFLAGLGFGSVTVDTTELDEANAKAEQLADDVGNIKGNVEMSAPEPPKMPKPPTVEMRHPAMPQPRRDDQQSQAVSLDRTLGKLEVVLKQSHKLLSSMAASQERLLNEQSATTRAVENIPEFQVANL